MTSRRDEFAKAVLGGMVGYCGSGTRLYFADCIDIAEKFIDYLDRTAPKEEEWMDFEKAQMAASMIEDGEVIEKLKAEAHDRYERQKMAFQILCAAVGGCRPDQGMDDVARRVVDRAEKAEARCEQLEEGLRFAAAELDDSGETRAATMALEKAGLKRAGL